MDLSVPAPGPGPDDPQRHEGPLRVMIVHAHPEPTSFNGALTRAGAQALRAAGHEVHVSDLYAQGFTAVALPGHFTPRHDPTVFALDAEQQHAHAQGTVPAWVAAEQAALARADVLVLQFPLWWFGPPAMLKGWFEQVLDLGFGYLPERRYDTGLLRGKLAVVGVTTGSAAGAFAPDGRDGALADILWPVHNGVLHYTGFAVAEPFVVHAPHALDDAGRTAALDAWGRALVDVGRRPRLFFHPAADYGPDARLRPGVVPRSGFQHPVDRG